MKKIILYIFIFTTCLFANNYDDMFNELEGTKSFIILDGQTKNTIEGAEVEISNSSNFSDSKGIVQYKPSEVEILEEGTINFIISKKGYIKYQGRLKVKEDKKRVYLDRDNKNKILEENKVTKTKVIKTNKNKKILTSKIRILSLEDGDLYLSNKKLRSIKSGRESFFRIKEGNKVLTLDTKKAVYRKNINVITPEMLVVFNKEDIIKIKEVKKSIPPVKEIKPVIKKPIMNGIKTEEAVKEITNDYLISEIVKPLDDGSAFKIKTKVNYFEMEEDEDKGKFVILKAANGDRENMNNGLISSARNKIGKNELLDKYYYVVTDLEVEFKEDYLNKIEEILNKIAIEKQDYISTNSEWNTEKDGKYIAFSSAKVINNDEILNKLYRISYKNTKEYSNFFKKLDDAIKRKREYQIRLFDKSSSTVVFNMIINEGYHYYLIDGKHSYSKYGDCYYSHTVNTTFGDKEISSSYSPLGRYLNELNYSLLGSLYNENNEYYFLNKSNAKMTVKLLKKNDGRKIIKSDYKLVK